MATGLGVAHSFTDLVSSAMIGNKLHQELIFLSSLTRYPERVPSPSRSHSEKLEAKYPLERGHTSFWNRNHVELASS